MMNDFTYHAPQTVAEAIGLLREAAHQGQEARLLAGGTVLVPQLKDGLQTPAVIVNLKRIPDLKAITVDERGLHLGAMVTPADLLRSPLVQKHGPALAQAAAAMAGAQIRNMATLGGNLCNAAPTADLIPSLIILATVVHIQGPGGARSLPVEQVCAAPGRTVLRPDEMVTGITVPRTTPPFSALYLKHALRRAMAIAIVGVGVAVQRHTERGHCLEARIALTAVAPTPVRAYGAEAALRGRPLTAAAIETAARQAAAEIQPEDDVRSSAWYRRRMVEVLVRRALGQLQEAP